MFHREHVIITNLAHVYYHCMPYRPAQKNVFMKLMKYLLLLIPLLLTARTYGQMTPDPTVWKYEVKKKGGHKYDLVFHMRIKQG